MLRVSEYFCRKGTKFEVGSVASSGWKAKTRWKTDLSYSLMISWNMFKGNRMKMPAHISSAYTYRRVVDKYQK